MNRETSRKAGEAPANDGRSRRRSKAVGGLRSQPSLAVLVSVAFRAPAGVHGCGRINLNLFGAKRSVRRCYEMLRPVQALRVAVFDARGLWDMTERLRPRR
jgi:hypothetical protein